MKNNFIHVCFIIDSSGSMFSSVNDVKGGFKKVVEEQKNETEGECAVSLFTFDGYVHEVFLGKNVNDIDSELNYNPGGSTALYDGIGTAIDAIDNLYRDVPDEAKPEKIMVVIMTDGEENCSRRYNTAQVKEMISGHEHMGWTFVYMGTELQNFDEAKSLGISSVSGSTRASLSRGFSAINSVTSAYRNTKGLAEAKYATMDNVLNAELDTMNTEYTAQTGVVV